MPLIKATPTPGDSGEDLHTAQLDAADPAERRRAVQALSGRREAPPMLVDLLKRETDNLVRQTAFLELATMRSADAAGAVAELLSEADPALRNGALETLVAMPDEAARLIAPLGLCEDPDVRIFAVLLAAEIPGDRFTGWLIDLAAREEDANVCSNLAEVLGGTARVDAIPALEAIRTRFADQPYLAFAVDTAIERIREA